MKKDQKSRNSFDSGLLTIAEAAEFLGVSRATFNKIRQENDISEVMVGQRPRFIKDDLMAMYKCGVSLSALLYFLRLYQLSCVVLRRKLSF